ncbi:MAG: OmpA family protein [Simkania negevensis]|nr:OmpA family protein [Simkania negevensis]
MKKKDLSLLLIILSLSALTSGCGRSSDAVWEDTKTVGRYLHRKGKLLWSKDVDSRMIHSADEFKGPNEEEFIGLDDDNLKGQHADLSMRQPRHLPDEELSDVYHPQSGLNIEQFTRPSGELSHLFHTLYFNTDEHVLKSKEDYLLVSKMADYIKKQEKFYLFIEGHCDQRASEDYNQALGLRRANTIRELLIKKGVNPNQIYTISYGKGMPVDPRDTPEAYAKNRRVEFKLKK